MLTPSVITEAIVRHKIKVFVVNKINNSYGHKTVKIFGVLTDEEKAWKLAEIEENNYIGEDSDVDVDEFILNDPELLNRIAKESENK